MARRSVTVFFSFFMSTMAEQDRPRVLNLTPHALNIYHDDVIEPVIIPSSGELRLLSVTPKTSLSHIHPLHYWDGASVEAAFPIIHAQVFVGLDEASPGFKHLASLTANDAVIVSMPVAHWLAKTPQLGHILSPATGPATVVRFDEEGPRKGQIKGVKALEYHEKQCSV
jgi:hypothetical protein